jgi:hypothetical protein
LDQGALELRVLVDETGRFSKSLSNEVGSPDLLDNFRTLPVFQ